MIKLGIYQHYNGNFYQVVGLARHSESLDEVVVYQSLGGDFGLWVRPLAMFTENVMIDGKETPRFRFVDTALDKAPGVR